MLSLLLCLQLAAQPVTIIGAEEPERFPEWYRWETAPVALSRQRPPASTLQLDAATRSFLFHEADQLVERWNAWIAEGEVEAETLRAQGMSEEDMYRALSHYDIDYRYEVLAVRDKIQETLSPEIVATFETVWMAEAIAASSVTLSGPAVELFFKPY